MSEHEWLADRFEANRAHLRAVAYRMLGSRAEAEDAVQEAWLRLARAEERQPAAVENLGGWLTTVVSRVCLDMLRSRASRREESLDGAPAGAPDARRAPHDAEEEALLADSVGAALLVVLDTLAPAERLAFVLHDLFGVSFDEIAPIVSRTPTAARQLASRARRRVQGAGSGAAATRAADRARQRRVVEAFLAASRGGDFDALLALLDPDVVLRADGAAARVGAPAEVRGARDVAGTFAGRARVARLALVGGAVGAVWAPGGEPRVAFAFTVVDGRVAAIELVADPERIRELAIVPLEG